MKKSYLKSFLNGFFVGTLIPSLLFSNSYVIKGLKGNLYSDKINLLNDEHNIETEDEKI